MNDTQLLRYSRHLLLDDIGVTGQGKLLSSHALVIGAGGLGSPVALYLGSAGVGRITIIDHDVVDTSNLQRQIAHKLSSVGHNKAESARDSIADRNPDPVVTSVAQRADAALLHHWVAQADVVIDCCDNFSTRHAINAACVTHRKPLVSGAAIRFDGQIMVFDARHEESPCYACVFPAHSPAEQVHCATMGVFAPLVGIIGSMQAAEAIKLLCGMPSLGLGRLLMLDAHTLEWTTVQTSRQTQCAICGR